MIQAVYSSLATPNLEQTDIQGIMDTAKTFNTKNGITGCLLYHNDQFTQVLEGNEKIIEQLYLKIKKDKRHFNVKLLYSNEVKERTFTNWSMAFKELSNDQLRQVSDTVFEDNLLLFSELANKPTLAIKLFWKKVKKIINFKNA